MQNKITVFFKISILSLAVLLLITGCQRDRIKAIKFSIDNNKLIFSIPALDDYFNGEYICIINGLDVNRWNGKQFKPIWALSYGLDNKITSNIGIKDNKLIYGKAPNKIVVEVSPKPLTSGIYQVQGLLSVLYAKDIDSDKSTGIRVTSYCKLDIDSNGKMVSVEKLSLDDLVKLGIFKE